MTKALAPIILTLYYGLIIYVLLGLNVALMGIVLVFVFFITGVSYLFLNHPKVQNTFYQEKSILQYICVVQMVLITLFIGFIVFFERVANDPITPLTGHLLFILSIIVQAFFMMPSIRQKWVQYALGFYLLAYLLFALYSIVPYGILLMVFGYVIIQNIVVITYGLLKYKNNNKIITGEG